ARYILPEFRERTANGERIMNPYAKLFEERIIFLGVQIDDASADDVMAQLLTLESMDPDREISIYINSPGGLPHARVLIHQPYTEGGGQGSDIEIQANEILRMRVEMEGILARHTGRTPEQVAKDIERDKILTAADAVEYGVIDQVIASRKMVTASAS
ncbi:MAG: ATP-dependent Clp protease proteolytic subunit, partial [Candidatus Nanopelagicales bacterium]|nr:ATP-dependent Clp protease proteolytic subunit [Candidatus Nanopelagicales bacterium]